MNLKNILLIKLLLIMLIIVNLNAKRDLPTFFEKLDSPVKAENFILKNMEGENVKLSDFKEKTIILNFWATWCPPCREEMPSLQKFYEKVKDKNIVVLALAHGENEDDVFPFVSQMQHEATFPILLDSDKSISIIYGVKAMPTTFLINKEGYITHYTIGARNFNSKEFINMILKF